MNMKMLRAAAAGLVIPILLSGCITADPFGMTSGAVANFRITDQSFAVSPGGTVAVTVADERAYVVDGTKSASFAGIVRDGFGMPSDVNTESGAALADDIAAAIAAGIEGATVVSGPIRITTPSLNSTST